MRDFRSFRSLVRDKLDKMDWTYKDLANATGYMPNTIERFMGKRDKRAKSEDVAIAIAKALDIPEHLAT